MDANTNNSSEDYNKPTSTINNHDSSPYSTQSCNNITEDIGQVASRNLAPPIVPPDGNTYAYPTFPGIRNESTEGSADDAIPSLDLGQPMSPPDGNASSAYPPLPGICNKTTESSRQAAMTSLPLGQPIVPPDGNNPPVYPLPYPGHSNPNQPMNFQQLAITSQPLGPIMSPTDGSAHPAYPPPYPGGSYLNQPTNSQPLAITTSQPLGSLLAPPDGGATPANPPGDLYPNYQQMSSDQSLITNNNAEANEIAAFMSRVRSNTIKKTEDDADMSCLEKCFYTSILVLLFISIPACFPCWLGMFLWHVYYNDDEKDN